MVVSTVDLACQSRSRRFAHKQKHARRWPSYQRLARQYQNSGNHRARSTVYLTDEVATILITHQNE
jgi:hypothetical protein